VSADSRSKLHADLHHGQLAAERERNRASAQRILGLVFERFRPGSLLDVGCGLGTWLAVARELGVADVRGVDGEWLDPSLLEIEPALAERRDLERGFDLGRRFDLVACLEVAEHLDAAAADSIIASLVAHGDVVLFSAAIPFQGGHHHVNEQFADYWAERFSRHGYRALDFIRPQIWTERGVHWWLRQNILVFAHERALERHAGLQREAGAARMLSVVLPEVYLDRMRSAQQVEQSHQQLLAVLSTGTTFNVERRPDGQLVITKLAD
jgi:SAM-dependent methyltransferase